MSYRHHLKVPFVLGATNQMNRAAVAEDMENEEEDEEYSDNFEDVRSHEETEDPARPSAPVQCT